MTFNEYIQNPMGKENSVISNRSMYRDLYQNKLDKILVREAGNIEFKGYSYGLKYLAYLKIPSEVIPDFYYDVLIEFSPSSKLITSGSLEDYTVRFYSNDPSFVYTFAHAFIKNDMFIKTLESKMSKQAVQKVAKEKNPNNQIGYVKSLYFAYLIMKKRGLFNKLRYVTPYSERALLKEIMAADEKIKLRQEAATATAKENRRKKKEEKELSDRRNNQTPDVPIQTKIAKTKTVSRIKKNVSTIKKTLKK